MKSRLFIATVLLFMCFNIRAQDGYAVRKDSIQSEVLGQNRKLNIFLPEGYDTSTVKFPVLYVLDADGRDQHTVPTARFLLLNSKMPRVIIVGIFNIDRNHDFLPDSSQTAPTGGGADKFIEFFKKELIPYIDKNFKTEPYKVLVGHSFGGVFAMHTLLTDPDLFDSFISIDPSFWYKKQMLVKNAQSEFLKNKNWKKSIYITGRDGGGMKDMGITPMEKLLRSSAPKDLNWKVVEYSNEDHGSVTFKSVYDGLRFIFDGGNPFMVYPQSGILPKGMSTFALIDNNNPYLRYTTDGSEPTINSPVCKDVIKINRPCTLKVKSIATNYKSLSSVVTVFSEGKFLKGLTAPENLSAGLKYSYYEGIWDSIPDFPKLTPVKTGITENIDLKLALKKDSFAVQFEGYLHVTKKDIYIFYILSDDGSRVYLNNELILDNNGIHSAAKPVVKLVPLEPGYYPLRISYMENNGQESISFGSVTGSKRPEIRPVAKDMLFHQE